MVCCFSFLDVELQPRRTEWAQPWSAWRSSFLRRCGGKQLDEFRGEEALGQGKRVALVGRFSFLVDPKLL